jgi:hypothetical protein
MCQWMELPGEHYQFFHWAALLVDKFSIDRVKPLNAEKAWCYFSSCEQEFVPLDAAGKISRREKLFDV